MPTSDDDPAADLDALVEATDIVLSGTIVAITRSVDDDDPDPDGGRTSWGWEAAPGQYAADVQGLVVACSEDEPPEPVIESLPLEAAGVPFAELRPLTRTIGPGSVDD